MDDEFYIDETTFKIAELIHKNKKMHFSEIHRHIGKPKETINRRLKFLVSIGLLVKERQGNKMYYMINKEKIHVYEKLMEIQKAIEQLKQAIN